MVRRFVALLEGVDPQTAKTVLATEDKAILAAVDEAVRRRLDHQLDPVCALEQADEFSPFDLE